LFDVNLIEEVLSFTRNIYKTYKLAPKFLKRHYLRFFFEKIYIKNKKISRITPTPIFAILQENQEVIITNNQLPSSPFILYKLFPKDLVAQVKVQLDVLKDILASKPDYSTIRAKNGQICKLPAPSRS